MISFLADSTKGVDSFHSSALENGGVNEGLPGIRSDGNYYAIYVTQTVTKFVLNVILIK